MSNCYCINPKCPQAKNPNTNLFCHSCGSELLLDGLYRVQCQLGGGGFAFTYEVLDDAGEAKVLKVLHLDKPVAVRLFQQEAEVLGKLNHPGIPKVEPDGYFTFFAKGSQTPLHCLVMGKILGENLQDYLDKRGQPISQKLALKWLMQLANILQEVHQKQFFHRDIKPPNIMLRPSGQLALIDFGTVKEITKTYLANQQQGQPGTIVYTPGYAAPEQEKGHSLPQSDFFALGRTFVHLLTNQFPLVFYDPHKDELNWRGAASNISPLLLDFLDELMACLPGQRPNNTQVILQRLKEIELKLYPPPTIPPQPNIQTSPTEPLFSNINVQNIPLVHTRYYAKWFNSGVVSVAFSPTRHLAAICSTNDNIKNIKIWQVAAEKEIGTLKGHFLDVKSVTFSPDEQFLASGSSDKTIKIWQVATEKEIRTLKGHSESVMYVTFSPDGQFLASGSADKTIKIWQVATGTEIRTLKGHSACVFSVAFSSDGQFLASGSADKTIKIWQVATGRVIRTLKGHSDWVSSVAFSSDGQFLASGSWDNTIKIWRLGRS